MFFNSFKIHRPWEREDFFNRKNWKKFFCRFYIITKYLPSKYLLVIFQFVTSCLGRNLNSTILNKFCRTCQVWVLWSDTKFFFKKNRLFTFFPSVSTFLVWCNGNKTGGLVWFFWSIQNFVKLFLQKKFCKLKMSLTNNPFSKVTLLFVKKINRFEVFLSYMDLLLQSTYPIKNYKLHFSYLFFKKSSILISVSFPTIFICFS